MQRYTSAELLATIRNAHSDNDAKTSCIIAEQGITYAELEKMSDIIAKHITRKLASLGLTDPSSTVRIGVNMERTINLQPAIYAIVKTGCSYVPIDATIPEERRSFIASDASIALTLTDDIIDGFLASGDADCEILHYNQPEAYVIYTSGTTGRPKGVPIGYSSLYHLLMHLGDKDNIQLDHDSVLLLFASINFDASIKDIFGTLFYGATMVIAEEKDKESARNIVSILNNKNITYASIPPSILAIMETFDFASLKTLVSGGEAMSHNIAEQIVGKRPYRFINAYGPTECTVMCTLNILHSADDCHNIGKPLPGVVAYVIDEHGNIADDGCEGELVIGGIQLTSGYINRPELNEAMFFANPFSETAVDAPTLYHTGDIVRKVEDGSFIYVGRKDKQIKLHGFRIEIDEIKAHILNCKGVASAYVRVEETYGDKLLVAYVILENNDTVIDIIKHRLALQLPYYMLPSFWNVIDSFPLTTNGKIDDTRLTNNAIKNLITNEGELTDQEEHIMQVVASILNLRSLNIDLDLINDVGLTSIQLMRLQYELERSAVGITVAGIYKHRTIRHIAQHCKKEPYYWYNYGDETKKPVLVFISGFTDFSYMYTKLADRLTDHFSIFVIESYHNILGKRWNVTAEQLVDIYIDILRPIKAEHHIAIIAGICNGGDQALLLAHKLFADSTYKPLVVNMDGELDRDADPEKNAFIDFPFFSSEVNKRRNHVDLNLYATFPKFHYDGPLAVFLCSVFIDYWTPLDPNMTPKKDYWMRRFFDTNAERWKQNYPELEITMLPASHADFWLTEPSLSIISERIIQVAHRPLPHNPFSPF